MVSKDHVPVILLLLLFDSDGRYDLWQDDHTDQPLCVRSHLTIEPTNISVDVSLHFLRVQARPDLGERKFGVLYQGLIATEDFELFIWDNWNCITEVLLDVRLLLVFPLQGVDEVELVLDVSLLEGRQDGTGVWAKVVTPDDVCSWLSPGQLNVGTTWSCIPSLFASAATHFLYISNLY